jgi:hypothetical protein
MRVMKFYPLLKLLFLFLIFCPFLLPLPVKAITIENPLKYNTLSELIEALAKFIFNVALALAPVLIVIGAFFFITAGGDPKKIETGKSIITWTIIGIIFLFLARGLIEFLKEALKVT